MFASLVRTLALPATWKAVGLTLLVVAPGGSLVLLALAAREARRTGRWPGARMLSGSTLGASPVAARS